MWFLKVQSEEIFFEELSKECNNPELRNLTGARREIIYGPA